jgi:alkylation response protein AidB-like acyl-CoA dehydrogenase
MNFYLSKEQQALRNSIITFADKELNKHISEIGKQNALPSHLWKVCAEQGLMGLVVGKEFGGAGLDAFSAIVAIEALGYGSRDGGFNFSLCAQLFACTVPLQKFGTEAQKKKYLPSICNGSIMAANAITENTAGSDIAAMRSSAKKEKDHYILNGSKTFISNGPNSNVLIVYALTDESKGFHGGITAFVFDKETPGVSTGPDIEKMGLDSCRMGSFSFDDVRLGEEHILGGPGGGATVFGYSMDWERAGIAACHVGAMEHLLETCISFVNEHSSGKEPIGRKQVIAHRIANMKVQLEAARLLTYRAASGLDKEKETTMHASIAKLFVSETFSSMASEAVQLHGARGYIRSGGIERILRDATASTIYSGTSDIQRNIIAGWQGL